MLRGRTDECDAIDQLVTRAAIGQGGSLLLQGDLGLGKTSLLRYAASRATDFTLLHANGMADEAHLPYAGLVALLGPVTGHLSRLPGHQAAALDRVLTGGGCPADQRLALRMSVLGLLDIVGTQHPVLCCVDDADILDPASFDVIAFAARRLESRPVAMVLAATDDQPMPSIARLRLAALDSTGSRQLLADHLPDLPEPFRDVILHHLAEVGQGNPQALHDLADSLTEEQRCGLKPLPRGLPDGSSLRHAYRQRLDRLPTETRDLLLLAAADDELEPATLVRAGLATGRDIASLAPAELSGLVKVADGQVVFPQPLVRATLYDTAPLAHRQQAHRRLAEILDGDRHRLRRAMHLAAATNGPDEALADELTAAAASCGRHSRASVALERAAELTGEPTCQALRLVGAARYAWVAGDANRARRLLMELRQSISDLPPSPVLDQILGKCDLLAGEMELRCGATVTAFQSLLAAADRLAGRQRKLAVRALMRAAEAVCFSGEYPKFADILRRCEALRRPDDPIHLELMFENVAGFAATFTGRHPDAIRPLRRVIELSEILNEPAALSSAAAASLLLADDHGARRLAAKAIATAEATGDRSAVPMALELMAYAEFWLGRYDSATATSLAGLHACRSSGQDNYAGDHLGMLAVLAAIQGDHDACQQRLDEIALPPGAGPLSRPRVLAQWALAVIDLAAARPAAALARLNGIADATTGRGHVVVQILATPWMVEAAVRCDTPDQALAAMHAYDKWALSTGDPVRQALSQRCHGLLAPRGSAEADAYFRRALELHARGEADFEQARTHLLYGQELRRARRPRDAREHLHRALETFRAANAPAWVASARAELRAAGEPLTAGPASTPAVNVADVLTAQQLQIARLVADGATNREVAARLFISTRTVDHHMRNIFSRLGIRSRTELVKALS